MTREISLPAQFLTANVARSRFLSEALNTRGKAVEDHIRVQE